MNIQLPKPPKQNASEAEWELWWEKIWNCVVDECDTSGDAAATVSSGSNYHGVTALTAPRTITLPDATLLRDGQRIVVQDESGSAGTHTITIAAVAGQNLYGSNTITTNYGRRVCIKRGTGKFYCQ